MRKKSPIQPGVWVRLKQTHLHRRRRKLVKAWPAGALFRVVSVGFTGFALCRRAVSEVEVRIRTNKLTPDAGPVPGVRE